MKICEVVWSKALKANLNEFHDNKILITFEFLRILYKNKTQLGNNSKNLKQKMVNYFNENEADLLRNYKTNDLPKAKRLLNMDLFLLKIEKLFSLKGSETNFTNIKVIN